MEEYFNKFIDIYLFVIENIHYLPAIFLICIFIILGIAGIVCLVGIIWGVIALIVNIRRGRKERRINEDKEIDDDITIVLEKIHTKEPHQ